MSDNKEEKIKKAYDEVWQLVTSTPDGMYETMMVHQGIIKQLDYLFEAGRTEGMLSSIE